MQVFDCMWCEVVRDDFVQLGVVWCVYVEYDEVLNFDVFMCDVVFELWDYFVFVVGEYVVML